MKILFLCTSNKDRSPALEKYFSDNYPMHEFRSAGINKYFTEQNNTHFLTKDDIVWADEIVAAETIHAAKAIEKYVSVFTEIEKHILILDLGEFTEHSREDYLLKADNKLQQFIFNQPTKP